MRSDSRAAGMAALSVCESILLSLVENNIISAAESDAILEDAAQAHREAVSLNDGAGTDHADAADLLQAIIDHRSWQFGVPHRLDEIKSHPNCEQRQHGFSTLELPQPCADNTAVLHNPGGGLGHGLRIFGESAMAVEPSERPLNHPVSARQPKAVGMI